MHVDNQTPFPVMPFEQLDYSGRIVRVLVARATFELSEERVGVASTVQEPICIAEEHYGIAGKSSLRQDSDIAPYKPDHDLVFRNVEALSPGDEPSKGWPVVIRCGDVHAGLFVTGPRMAMRHRGGLTLSEPVPVRSVPIKYELACGGLRMDEKPDSVFLRNPVGRRPDLASESSEVPLPQIICDADFDVAESRCYLGSGPSGLGPIHRSWKDRLSFAGTYDEKWMGFRWPLVPEDFSPRFYNSAPSQLRSPASLAGNRLTALGLRGMPSSSFQLPTVRLNVSVDSGRAGTTMLPARHDTTIVDLANSRLVYVWRFTVFPELAARRCIIHAQEGRNNG